MVESRTKKHTQHTQGHQELENGDANLAQLDSLSDYMRGYAAAAHAHPNQSNVGHKPCYISTIENKRMPVVNL